MNRLKLLREEKKLNQNEVGKYLGITGQAYGLYENEKRTINNETLIKLADYFEVSTDYLLGKSDIRNPEKGVDFDPDKLRIGLSKKDYENITDEQMKQIEELAKVILKDNLKDKDKK